MRPEEPPAAKPRRRVAALSETRSQTVAEYRRTLSDDLAKAEQKAAGSPRT